MSDNKNIDNTTFTWTLTQTDDIDENFFSTDKENFYNHVNVNTWTTSSLNTITTLIKDIIDAPIKELTLDQIKCDFSSRDFPISEDTARQICDYYNVRYTLQQSILNDISSFTETQDANSISSLTYQFPKNSYDYVMSQENSGLKYNNMCITLDIKGNNHI